MSHRILMLGGKRAGKSSLLASILYTLKYEGPESCHCADKTLYKAGVTDLETKRKELEKYIRRFGVIGGKSLFLVDSGPNSERHVYTLRLSIGNASTDLDFIDVPGEWMSATSGGYNDLIDEVKESDVFLVAIDTPMLMEAPGYLSRKYNRIYAIQSVLNNMRIENGDRKLILFCPIKCERWIQEGRINDVVSKVRSEYADIINTWMAVPEVEMAIIPVQTAGGIQFAKQLPGKMMRRNLFSHVEELCSFDEESRRYLMPEGFFLEFHPDIQVREDAVKNEFPLSWFKINSVGYKPESCDKVALNVIRFLVDKEIEYCTQKKEQKKWWQIWKPPFGVYLACFQRFIERIKIDKDKEYYLK